MNRPASAVAQKTAKKSDKVLLKLGVRCHPPAITLLYKEDEKKRLRVMPVRFLNKTGTVDYMTEDLTERHKEILSQVPKLKLEKMLRILQEVQKGSPVEKASDLVRQQYMIDPNQDLNKLTEEELTTKKKLMETSFLKNQVKKGDEGFQYDIQVNFDKEEKTKAGWDSEDNEDEFWS
ncbi:UNVERIFIED_CONTAM: hypothetical protein RMT77_004679 [Armadillidium vulgare]